MVDLDWHIAVKALRENDPKFWTLKRLSRAVGKSFSRVQRVLKPEYEAEYLIKRREHILARKRAYYYKHRDRLNLIREALHESRETGIPRETILRNWGASCYDVCNDSN